MINGRLCKCQVLICLLLLSLTAFSQGQESWWPEQKLPTQIIRVSPSNLAQRNLVQSVSGLAARAVNAGTNNELVWTNVSGAAYNYYLSGWLARTSVADNGNITVWNLVDRFKNKGVVKGYVLYTEGDYSVNFATLYASMYDAILVEAGLESTAIAHGLTLKYDARPLNSKTSYTQAWFDGIKGALNNKMVVTIAPNDYRQREMAISNNCMVYWGVDDFYNTILSWMKPNSPVVGWNENEGPAVVACSKYGMFTTGATVVNLSVLSAGAKQLTPPKVTNINPRTLDFSTGRHYHSFVLSDGDNMMIQATSLPLIPEYWGNPDINNVPMNWTNCPVNLSEMIPDAWNYFVNTTTVPGNLIEFGGGYQYPDYFAQSRDGDAVTIQREFAEIVNKRMKATGTKVFSFITRNSLSSAEALGAYQIYAETIDDLVGIVAIQYIPYNAGGGNIYWVTNKQGKHIPVFTAKYQMWADLNQYPNSGNPAVIASLINSAANQSPTPTIDWTIVHAWSYFKKDAGGNISDAVSTDAGALRGVTPVTWAKALLDTNINVVSIEELLWRLRMKYYPAETQAVIDGFPQPLSTNFRTITANKINGSWNISWTVDNESNTKEYIIEASGDGKQWKEIGRQAAKTIGASSQKVKYDFVVPGTVEIAGLSIMLLFLIPAFGSRLTRLGIGVAAIALLAACSKSHKIDNSTDNGNGVFIRITERSFDGKLSCSKAVRVLE
ncbi:GxGYxYP domain-containing protein [Niabella beijingensis]|uniref:GxGYxYP domain-containing protein n=1 Tax=Niabella beijingensis TaxID=2872700 RepID=UPI001CBDF76D|nr:GxGYxYP domain-containing protein [Niabella beijingensis]MBZ4192274.1 hypothetical protein [Niabella beijingensis]